jgi:uncharacterized protein (TIGR04255 family)
MCNNLLPTERPSLHYSKTFLKTVILRLDYARVPLLLTDRETTFTQEMKARYPNVISTPAMQFSFMMGPGVQGGVNVGQQSGGYMRVHRTSDNKRTLTLSPDFLAIEYTAGAYDHFAELREQVGFALRSFREHFDPVQFTRVGLRYVNEITRQEGSPLDWAGLINPELVTAVKAGMQNDLRMTRSAHQLIAIKDDLTLILNYGINNPDFPNVVARRQFVLDLDCYVSGMFESGEVEARIKDVNGLAEKIFENSIGDDLRAEMGIINEH